MPALKNLTGKIFGRLTVTSFSKRRLMPSGSYQAFWSCLCECGTIKEVYAGNLNSGSIKSCGCLRNEILNKTTHGLFNTDHYNIWVKMLSRCEDPEDASYSRYGGRGIVVCDRWHKLENFVLDMGPRPKGYSIDRVNNDGPYSPENCRWATDIQQANNKRNNRYITCRGQTQTIAEWARELGINQCTLHSRLKKLDPETAFSPPPDYTYSRKGRPRPHTL